MNSELLQKQKTYLVKQLQNNDSTKYLLNIEDIANLMVYKRIKLINTYILLCEQMGWCVGKLDQTHIQLIDNDRFNLSLIQLELDRIKLQRKQKRIKKKVSNKLELLELLQQPEQSTVIEDHIVQRQQTRQLKLQQHKTEILKQQSLKDIIKIEEYFKNKKKTKQIEITPQPQHVQQPITDAFISNILIQYITFLKQL